MTTSARDIQPIVLAAGASARMGRPKALLGLGGATVMGRVIGACGGAGTAAPIVVAAAAAAEIQAHAVELGARVVLNPRPERGQLSSLQEGLRALPAAAAAFLLFPVDYALVEPEDVRALIEAFARRRADEKVFVPSFGGRRGHPVLVDAALAPALLALPDGATARVVLGAQAPVHVATSADRVLHDLDTPEDYQRAVARLG